MVRLSVFLSLLLVFFLSCASGVEKNQAAWRTPSHLISEKEWKLQFPGGTKMAEQKLLGGYASRYYSLYCDEDGTEWIHFALDGADSGHSKNTRYVRSELRHVENWNLLNRRSMSYTFRANASQAQSSYTVGQIHILPDDSVIPGETSPLLRLEIVKNQFRAKIKDYADGHYETIILCGYKDGSEKRVAVETVGENLSVFVDGEKKFTRRVFCPFKNYFKVGIYPQQTHGLFDVFVKDLVVEIE